MSTLTKGKTMSMIDVEDRNARLEEEVKVACDEHFDKKLAHVWDEANCLAIENKDYNNDDCDPEDFDKYLNSQNYISGKAKELYLEDKARNDESNKRLKEYCIKRFGEERKFKGEMRLPKDICPRECRCARCQKFHIRHDVICKRVGWNMSTPKGKELTKEIVASLPIFNEI
jgi:hypothetical protein